MTIAEREQQILRVKKQGFHKELDEALADKLISEVVFTVKTVLENALNEEVTEFLKSMTGEEKPHRSGYYNRGLNTQYGQIPNLAVPKLRSRNREREWQILQRYERSLGNLLDWMCCLYVMGLSLRDLQEALYFILGKVLSVSAVNGIERHLNYLDLPQSTPTGQTLKLSDARQQRRFEIISDAYKIYETDLASDAQLRLQDFQIKWSLLEPDAVRTFMQDIQLTFSFYQFDSDLHHHIRTTNHLERLFREFRTKSDEIGAFPNETSCLTVFWLVIERDHAKHNRRSSANNS